jgi:hypothetical protein
VRDRYRLEGRRHLELVKAVAAAAPADRQASGAYMKPQTGIETQLAGSPAVQAARGDTRDGRDAGRPPVVSAAAIHDIVREQVETIPSCA